jgi:SAM-dependent methyltransferase
LSRSIFDDVYEQNTWGDPSSRSGSGSSVQAARHLVRELPLLFRDLRVRSILDAPCGDFEWFREILPDDVAYTGLDIVGALIAETNARYGGPNRRFIHGDVTQTPLSKVDLVLCRDCFIHLPLPAIQQALKNFASSGSTWLLTTHFQWRAMDCNGVIEDVSLPGRRINLELAPFGFPPPLRAIPEGPEPDMTRDKTLALWRLDGLSL